MIVQSSENKADTPVLHEVSAVGAMYTVHSDNYE